MTDRQFELLRWLDDATWKTPQDIGGHDGSHHSATLMQLVRHGYAETKKLHAFYCPNGMLERLDRNGKVITTKTPYQGCRCKGSRRYRRTTIGKRASLAARHNNND